MKSEIMRRLIPGAIKGLVTLVLLISGFSNIAKGEGDQQFTLNRGDRLTRTVSPTEIPDKALTTEKSFTMEKSITEVQEKGPRLTPMPMSEMRAEWIKTLEKLPGAGLKGLYTPVNVFGTLMYNPETMGSFLENWVTSKLKMGFSGREQELIILRMGFLYNCNYVWKHHLPVAKEFGVNDSELEAVKISPLPSVFSARESALLMLTDELVEHRTIRDEAWSKWSGELKKSELVDLVSIVSQYVFFALFNNALRIEIEEPLSKIPGL